MRAIESALERLAGWLQVRRRGRARSSPSVGPADDRGVDRLFRHLVPDVTGRRSGHEIIGRLRRKWDLGHSLHEVLSAGSATRSTPWPTCAARPATSSRGSTATTPRSPPIRSPRSGELVAMLGHHGVDLDRVELDLGFGRGIGFYTQMIFELTVPTPDGPVEVCGGGRYDGLARVLGQRPRRPRRRVRLRPGTPARRGRRADRSGPQRRSAPRGYLVTSVEQGKVTPETIDLATFLRERIQLPIVLSDLDFDAAIAHARASGLSHVVTVGRTIEVWNLEHGDVRSVREGEIIEQMRTRFAVFRGDRS